jgi:hypothetical protein
MQYIMRTAPRPPIPKEQAREFWDVVQKLSLLFGLFAAIRSLSR